MQIIRISAQSRQSLLEFYGEAADIYRQANSQFNAERMEQMGCLLQFLDSSVDAPPVYAVTSHYFLKLLPGDDWQLPTLVVIEPTFGRRKTAGFDISYKLPPAEAPWENAWVHGLADEIPQAAEMIQVALQRNAYATERDS